MSGEPAPSRHERVITSLTSWRSRLTSMTLEGKRRPSGDGVRTNLSRHAMKGVAVPVHRGPMPGRDGQQGSKDVPVLVNKMARLDIMVPHARSSCKHLCSNNVFFIRSPKTSGNIESQRKRNCNFIPFSIRRCRQFWFPLVGALIVGFTLQFVNHCQETHKRDLHVFDSATCHAFHVSDR